MKQLFYIFTIALFATQANAQCPGPVQRNALINLQKSILAEGTLAGQIPLTDTCGNQRYAQYVEINPDTIAYTPTPTGNTANLSEFVFDPSGSLWYIDWQGNAVEFAGGSSACDADWLQISDNSCPDALTDSIYKYKYAAIGARLVWPSSELLVNDSSSAVLQVLQGSRNARLALYDLINQTWVMIDHGGSAPYLYFPVDADFIFSTASGTPQSPSAEVSHFAVNASDSTIQMHQYPDTRDDTEAVNNFLYTDATGKIRSKPTADFPITGGGIYGGSDIIPDGTVATIPDFSTFSFRVQSGATFQAGDYAGDLSGVGFKVEETQVGLGDIFGAGNYYGYFGTAGNYIRSPASNFQQLASSSIWDILSGSTYRFTDSRVSKAGVEYSSADYGAGFTDSTLVHRRYVADMISDSISSLGGGTVTSVGLSLPAIFSVSGSPVTTSGTLTGSLVTQTANTVFAGPVSGVPAAPTFRTLVAADLPTTGTGGAFVQGGNSFAATAVLGTNDSNTLSFETNNTTRATLSTTGVFTVTDVTAATNTLVEKLVLGANTSGTAAIGLGPYISFVSEISSVENLPQGRIATRWNATGSNGSSEMDFYTTALGVVSAKVTIEDNGDVGIGSQNPLIRFTNGPQPSDGNLVTGAGMGWSVSTAGSTYAVGFTNSSGSVNSHGTLVEANATDNGSRALTVSVGGTPTRVFNVNCDQKVGILDITPESELDVTGTTSTNHLIGQNLTPTISVNTAGAGTGASASMTNAQSSDLAGRFSITSGTGATTGLWATITFDDAFTVTPIVQVYFEDEDASNLKTYVNTSTTSFELFINGGQADATVYEFNFIIIGGK